VTCDELNPWLHGYVDGELDLARNLEIEGHMEGCPTCAASLRQLRDLRQSLGDRSLYHRAPPGLRQRVLAALPRATRPRLTVADFTVRSLAVAASFALLVILVWGVLRQSTSRPAEEQLAQEVVSNHVRSLLVGDVPRVDKISSDRHEVKPWFNGRVPFAPIVRDLESAGYALIGGRLDYLANRKVAAIVYMYRKHPINLFTWPADGSADQPPHVLSRQGYQLVSWTQSGMAYWAIADLNEEELLRFAELIRR
jgi:anti-sigma factor RsiW